MSGSPALAMHTATARECARAARAILNPSASHTLPTVEHFHFCVGCRSPDKDDGALGKLLFKSHLLA